MQVDYEPGTNLIKFVWKFALKQSPPLPVLIRLDFDGLLLSL